jgi:hypothetical protein
MSNQTSNQTNELEVIDLDNGSYMLVTPGYVHVYDDIEHTVNDVALIYAGENTNSWDNNEMEREGWNPDETHICQHYDISNGATCYTALEFLEMVQSSRAQ